VAGCWINRDGAGVAMRWTPDQSRPGAMTAYRTDFGQTGPNRVQRFSLEPSPAGWSLCELEAGGAAVRCWRVAEGDGGSLEGGRVFIDAHGDRLRVAVLGDGPEHLIFNGRRQSCG
jgi:hypothetical protein